MTAANGRSTDGVDATNSATTDSSSSSIKEVEAVYQSKQEEASTVVLGSPVYTSTLSSGQDRVSRYQQTGQLQQPSSTTTTNSEGQHSLMMLPMHTMPDGRKVFLLAPSSPRQHQQPPPQRGHPATVLAGLGDETTDFMVVDSPTIPVERTTMMSTNGQPPNVKTKANHLQRRRNGSYVHKEDQRGIQKIATGRQEPLSFNPSDATASSYQSPPTRGGTYQASPSSSEVGGADWMMGFPMPSVFAMKWALYLMAVAGSVLGGGILAKRALDRMDRWEQLSQEDSLAFDIAYTSPYNSPTRSPGKTVGGLANRVVGGEGGFLYASRSSTSSSYNNNNNDGADSESSYGSFSTTGNWQGDRLNLFDV